MPVKLAVVACGAGCLCWSWVSLLGRLSESLLVVAFLGLLLLANGEPLPPFTVVSLRLPISCGT